MIEILWKQDIDIGIPRDHFLFPSEEENESGHVNEEEALLKEKLNASGQVLKILDSILFFHPSVLKVSAERIVKTCIFALRLYSMDCSHKTLNFTYPFLIFQTE